MNTYSKPLGKLTYLLTYLLIWLLPVRPFHQSSYMNRFCYLYGSSWSDNKLYLIWFWTSVVGPSVCQLVSYLLSATVDSEKMCLLTVDTITQFHTNQLAVWTGLLCSQSGAAEVPVTHPPTPYYWSSLNKCCARFNFMLYRNNHRNTAKACITKRQKVSK